jgi:UDP:flavonoid glycosyltransferase YjiC (YdhE family)
LADQPQITQILPNQGFSMNITILTQGSRGDVQPYVALGVGLQRAGMRVRMPAPEIFRRLITEAGLEYVPVHGFDPQEFIRDPEIQAAVRGGQLKILVSLLRKAGALLEGMFDEYWRASDGADALIASTLVFGIADCAEKRGIPCLYAPIHPLLQPTRAFPSTFFAPFGARENHFVNRFTHQTIHFVFGIMFHAALNRWRLKMGLPRVGNYFRYVQDQTPLVLYGFSPSVLPIPGDWPPNHHVCGYWFLDQPPGWEPPPALLKFLESGPPPVYAGFGSMDTGHPSGGGGSQSKRSARRAGSRLEQPGRRIAPPNGIPYRVNSAQLALPKNEGSGASWRHGHDCRRAACRRPDHHHSTGRRPALLG